MTQHRPRILFIGCVLLVLTLNLPGSTPAAAGTLTEEVGFDRQDLTFSTIGEYDLVTVPSATYTEEVGAPLLPARTIHILLPPATRLSGVRIVGVQRELLGSGYHIHPCQPPAPTDGSPPPEFVEPSAVYQSNLPYPSSEAVLISENRFGGYRLASVTVYPLSYRPKNGELTLNRSVRLSVTYEPEANAKPRKRISLRAVDEMERVARALVKNPAMLDSYRDQALTTLDTTVAGPLSLEVMLSEEGGDWLDQPGRLEYLIITAADLADEFQPLADWKTKKGVPATVVTVDWIAENYAQGCDLQETIRNFLIEVKNQHPGLAYVLIGGDVDVVPVRLTAQISGDSRPIPTDLYYGDIDPPTNWNANGDAEFGDYDDGQDAVPDLHVGRAPVNSADQAVTFVTKTLFWERELPADHSERLLMLGASAGDYEDGRGAVNKEAIGADFVPANILAYYLCGPQSGESYLGTWSCDDEFTRQTTLDEINDGYLFVNHQDHSHEYAMGTGTKTGGGTMDRADMDALANGPYYSVLFTLGCSPGAFDYDCVVEHFVRSPDGGGPLAIANSRTGYWGQNEQDRVLMEALYQTGLNLGQAAALTKTANFSLYYRYVQNTLGDPELPFYTENPGSLVLTRPTWVGLGNNNITIGVYDGDSSRPVEGALVCAMKGLEDYAVGITGLDGQVTFLFDTDTPGIIDLTVTSPDYMPVEDSIGVDAPDTPFVYLDDWSVDDDTSDTSWGNGDGIIDAGETVELPVTLHNSGEKTARRVKATLEKVEPGPYVRISDRAEEFGDIGADSTATSRDDFDIEIDADCPPGHTVEMKLTITAPKISVKPGVHPHDPTGGDELRTVEFGPTTEDPVDPVLSAVPQYVWVDYFTLRVEGPDLRLVSYRVDDSDGDDVVEPGEQVELPVTLENVGLGTGGGITGVLATLSPYVTLTTSSVSFPDLGHLEDAVSDTPFAFEVDSQYDGSPLPFDLYILDQHGNLWAEEISISLAPEPPSGLSGLAGSDHILLTWDPHASPEVAGYQVYRADQSGGPYVRINPELVEGSSLFHDTGLAGATYFFYTVTAVDASGREGDPSAELSIQTTLEGQDGWPIRVSGAASSPLVTDIDDDGDPELLFGGGDSKIYAFHHSGEEVLDIDLNPTTISGFAVTAGAVGVPSAADIDNDGLMEIIAVANSGTSHQVYAWRSFDGPDADAEADLVGGWPVSTPDRVGAVSAPALGDVDGDGDLEIFVGGDHQFYGWHHDGSGIVNPDGLFLDAGSWIYGTAAIADLNDDGNDDVIIGGGDDGMLYAVDGAAAPLAGSWPVLLGSLLSSSPAVGDLDGDGSLEVVVATMGDQVHVLRADGSPFGQSWPAAVPQNDPYSVSSSVSLSDLDGDGTLEVVVGSSDARVYAWHWDGAAVTGWPTEPTDAAIHSSPALGDLDGDGVMEVVAASTGGLIFAWNLAADVVPGWPITMGDRGSSPAIIDLDQDGDVDVAAGSASAVMYVWDCDGIYNSQFVGWEQFHHDAARTGEHE